MIYPTIRWLLHAILGVAILSGGLASAADPSKFSEAESVTCSLGSLAEWNIKRLADCHSMKVFEYPPGSGNQVGRFDIRPDDPQISSGWRAEIKDGGYSVNGDREWYRFTTVIPVDFPIGREHSIVTAQWHESQFEGNPSQRPPIAHRLVNGEFRITLWNDRVYDITRGKGNGLVAYTEPGFALGKVQEFIYRIDWRPDEAGSVRVWKRECDILDCQAEFEQIVNYQGAIGYRNVIGYYFKAGIYTVHPFDTPMSVYHTAYGRGPTPESVGIDVSKDLPFRQRPANLN